MLDRLLPQLRVVHLIVGDTIVLEDTETYKKEGSKEQSDDYAVVALERIGN
jgi:hypothetical protein